MGPDGKLHVYFFDVGQGDSALIVTPQGKQVLVDGGPEAESAVRALSGPMSAGDRSLDMMVLTHLDADHSRGLLEVLDRYRVASVVVGLENPDSSLYAEWQAGLERAAPIKIPVQAGHRIILEPDLSLEVLNPPARPIGGSIADQNNNGVVLRIVYNRVSFLLAADIEAMAENYLARRTGSVDSTVLKVATTAAKHRPRCAFFPALIPWWPSCPWVRLTDMHTRTPKLSKGLGRRWGLTESTGRTGTAPSSSSATVSSYGSRLENN